MSKQTTFKEFFESIDFHEVDTWIDETHWDGEGCSSRWMEDVFKWVVKMAQEAGVTLTDVESFDYESYLEDVYDCAEKGLS